MMYYEMKVKEVYSDACIDVTFVFGAEVFWVVKGIKIFGIKIPRWIFTYPLNMGSDTEYDAWRATYEHLVLKGKIKQP